MAVAVGGWVVAMGADAPAAVGTGTAASAGGSASPAATPASSSNLDTGGNDLAILEQFLRQPPARITQLRKALDYLDNMTPAQRDVLLRDLQARRQNIALLRTEISPELKALTNGERDVLNRYWVTLFPEDIQVLHKRFQDAGTNADARKTIIQEMLKAAADKGIKANTAPPDRGMPPGGNQRGSTPGGRGRGTGSGRSASGTTASAPATGSRADN